MHTASIIKLDMTELGWLCAVIRYQTIHIACKPRTTFGSDGAQCMTFDWWPGCWGNWWFSRSCNAIIDKQAHSILLVAAVIPLFSIERVAWQHELNIRSEAHRFHWDQNSNTRKWIPRAISNSYSIWHAISHIEKDMPNNPNVWCLFFLLIFTKLIGYHPNGYEDWNSASVLQNMIPKREKNTRKFSALNNNQFRRNSLLMHYRHIT